MPNCRECNLRERCIEECSTSPSVRLMMRRAFEAETDTEQMWRWLQESCLLLSQQHTASRPSALERRLKAKLESGETAKEVEEVTPVPSAAVPATTPILPSKVPRRLGETEREKEETAPSRYCLVLRDGQHRVSLPADGKIVLGRFDPATRVTPDVDLSYDDRESRVISRLHARISGRNGRHEIEDLGSTNGTQVNGTKLEIGQKVVLKPGDQVTLGHCKFIYAAIPEMRASPHTTPPKAYFLVAFTGHQFFLPAWGKGIIGRRDETIDFTPDIDLSEERDAARLVARRHARIVIRSGRHYVEDLGSTSGTKLNGVPLKIGKLGQLKPGDHLWLGGCVLNYDVEQDKGSSD